MLKRALVAMPIAGFGIVALAACTPSTPNASAPSTPAPTSTVLTTTASSAAPAKTTSPTATQAADTTSTGCQVNPANAQMPSTEAYQWVPKADQMQVSLSAVPATVRVTGAPVEVDMTVCNNSPVAYPQAAFVLALDRGSSAPAPLHIAEGTVQRFDNGQWVTLPHPHVGNDVGYLGQFAGQQPMPKGKAVTIRYRFTYDNTMGNGTGGLLAAVVTPDANAPIVLGSAKAAYTVAK